MAVWTFLRNISEGTEIMSSSIYDGFENLDVLFRSSTQLRLQDPEFRDIFTFTGTGLTYSLSGGTLSVTGGTLTGLTGTYNGQIFATWTGINISAATMSSYVRTDNWTALNALIFNTSDTYNLTDGRDKVRAFGGNDQLNGFGGNDTLYGDSGNDALKGGTGNDLAYGGIGNDSLWGESGNDKLFGDSGNDRLSGSFGNDTLIGGTGIDTMTGGTGADVFAFNHTGATNREILTDFNAVDDALHFNNDAFTAFSYTGQLRSSHFVSGTNALDTNDRFIYQQSTGSLWYDRDGSGAAAKVLVAELVDGTRLTSADIFIL